MNNWYQMLKSFDYSYQHLLSLIVSGQHFPHLTLDARQSQESLEEGCLIKIIRRRKTEKVVQRGLLTIKSNHHQYFSATVTVLDFFNYWSNLWPPAALITNDTCVKSTWRLRGCLLAAVAYFRTGQLLGRGLTPYTWHISEYLECNLKKSVAKLHRMANFVLK